MPSQETERDYLRNQYKDSSNFMARVRLHAHYSTNPNSLAHWMLDQFDVPVNGQILELGAGPGVLWTSNAQRIPAGWQVTLSDYSPGMVMEQRRNVADIPVSFRFGVVDAQNIPFGDATFDMVTANFMLYHVPDIPRALNEMKRVLKPGGQFYAVTNGDRHMHELDELVARYSGTHFEQGPSLTFTLENGIDIIAPIFPNVTLRHYEDSLVVTDAEPIVAYVLSGRMFRTAQIDESPDGFRAFVQQEMSKTGAIQISKATGMFVASRT